MVMTSATRENDEKQKEALHGDEPWRFSLPEDVDPLPDHVVRHHERLVRPNQCCSALIQLVDAPLAAVWSILRRFDQPHAYNHFLRSCDMIRGDGNVGSVRKNDLVSGLSATYFVERLELLDDEHHVLSVSIIGGDQRIRYYQSAISVHISPSENGVSVIESYVADIPPGNTGEDTRLLIETFLRCKLKSLAFAAETMNRTFGAQPT